MENTAIPPKINWMAEFRDKRLEQAYTLRLFAASRDTVCLVAMMIAAVYLMFGLYDLVFNREQPHLLMGLLLRALVFVMGCAVALYAKRSQYYERVTLLLTVQEMLLVFSYQLLLAMGGTYTFTELAIPFLVILMAAFLLPNRWIYAMVFALSVMLSFLVSAPFVYAQLNVEQWVGVLLYMLFVVALGGVYSRNLSVTRRLQFYHEYQLELMSGTDHLTQIYNRQKFDEVFERWLRLCNSGQAELSIIMFDLDDFKVLNDTHGHARGDQVLVQCVEVIRSRLRANDVFARWGGEEFMLLLPNTSFEAAVGLAERLRAVMEDTDFGCDVQVTASFGVACACAGDDTDTLVQRVDAYLYQAKQAGKNQVCAAG